QLAELQRPPTTAANSSLAPSANPIGAPPVVVKKPTGRTRGGQVGHAGRARKLLPQSEVDEVVEHRPAACRSCGSLLDQQGEVLGCPIALGSISAREEELSHALAEPYGRLVSKIAAAPLKHVDETGWKLAGKSRWLFVAAGASEAVFGIEKTRTHPALRRFL